MQGRLNTPALPSVSWGERRSLTTRSGLGTLLFRFREHVPQIAGAGVILVGCAVFAGWALGLPGLSSIHPVLATMGPRTALCLVFGGAGLWFLSGATQGTWRRRLGQACAVMVILASLFALGLSWTNWMASIDFFPFNATAGTILSPRMPTATALAFLSLGLALLLLEIEFRRFRPSEFFTFAAVLIVVLAFVAYSYGSVSFFQIPVRRPLAIHTLVAFLTLSFGILMARKRAGLMSLAVNNSVGGLMVRRLLPAAVVIPALVGWLIVQGERAGLYPAVLDLAYYTLAIVVVFSTLIWMTAISLHRMDTDRQRAQEQVRKLNADLERRVVERTAQLEAANKELESFSYSVSHDLRAPLRAIDGFSRILLEDHGEQLNEDGKSELRRVCDASQRMGQLIDDLLSLSRVTRNAMQRSTVDLSALTTTLLSNLRREEPERVVGFIVEPGLTVEADSNLMRVALENLLRNAWKFTRKTPNAKIEVGTVLQDGRTIYFVRDNGAGFDMTYADKLFGAFQRLHKASEFEGTGIGLATVQRIIHRHGGQLWAEGAVEQGATFYFTL